MEQIETTMVKRTSPAARSPLEMVKAIGHKRIAKQL